MKIYEDMSRIFWGICASVLGTFLLMFLYLGSVLPCLALSCLCHIDNTMPSTHVIQSNTVSMRHHPGIARNDSCSKIFGQVSICPCLAGNFGF
jgi:hypothetical protein